MGASSRVAPVNEWYNFGVALAVYAKEFRFWRNYDRWRRKDGTLKTIDELTT